MSHSSIGEIHLGAKTSFGRKELFRKHPCDHTEHYNIYQIIEPCAITTAIVPARCSCYVFYTAMSGALFVRWHSFLFFLCFLLVFLHLFPPLVVVSPGHDILMATMLNGAAVMDAALLLIAGNESCPQPQTSEHLAAVEIMKLKHILILQNKIDLVKEKEAASQYEEILAFIRGTVADGSPIIPISAQLKYNIEVICEYICKKIPVPVRDFTGQPQMIVIRSFDVNKPGEEVENLKGGVAGGSILRGVLKVGQEIEIRPGIVTKDKSGGVRCLPIKSKIVSLYAEHNDLAFAVPGGLIGVGTKIDPTLTRADRLVGQVLGDVNSLPDIFSELEISFFLLRRLLGVKQEGDKKKGEKIKKLTKGEILMVNIGSTSTGARILQVKGDLAKVVLTSPVCTSEGEKLALSRRVDKHWRLIGWGRIRKGTRIVAAEAGADGEAITLAGDDQLDELTKNADAEEDAAEGKEDDEAEDGEDAEEEDA